MIYEDYILAERFKVPKRRRIEMVRGDTLSFSIRLFNLVKQLETVAFSCSKKNSNDYIFNETIENGGVVGPDFREAELRNLTVGGSGTDGEYFQLYGSSSSFDSDSDTISISSGTFAPSENTVYILTNDNNRMVYWTGESSMNRYRFKNASSIFYKIRVAPEDTKEVEPGEYIWDLQVGGDGDIFTLAGGTLTILPEETTM